MSEYTGLRFKAYIKPKFRKYIHELVYGDADSFVELYNFYPQELYFLEYFVKNFSEASRIGVVGGDSYMPKTWQYNEIEGDSFSLFAFSYDPLTGIFQFSTVTTNYKEAMQYFVVEVAPHLIEKVVAIYTHYNDSSLYRCYDILNGVMKEVAIAQVDMLGYVHKVENQVSSFVLTDEWKKHLDYIEDVKPESSNQYRVSE